MVPPQRRVARRGISRGGMVALLSLLALGSPALNWFASSQSLSAVGFSHVFAAEKVEGADPAEESDPQSDDASS